MTIKITFPKTSGQLSQFWWECLPGSSWVKATTIGSKIPVVLYKGAQHKGYLAFYEKGKFPYVVAAPWNHYTDPEKLPPDTVIDLQFKVSV